MKALQTAAALAVILLFAGLATRAYFTNRTNEKLCRVLYSLVARSGATVGKPGTPGYAYYHAHPSELEAAHRQNHEFLSQLPCKGH